MRLQARAARGTHKERQVLVDASTCRFASFAPF